MMRALLVAVLVACGGGGSASRTTAPETTAPTAPVDRILAMLPQGAQVVAELDLARLRANPVVGELVTRALAAGMALPGEGDAASPLAAAELVVLAAYGVGTANAATVTVLASPQPVAGAAKIADGIYALAPEAWTVQLAQRAALLDAAGGVRAPPELLALRDRAMPPKAPGAALRVTAQLAFDARIALARQAGLESAPAQLSIWGDVVDDLAIIVDADATDPGERRGKQSVARMQAALRGALASLAGEPIVQALGVPRSLTGAKLSARGVWVRAIIAIGPEHLKRVVSRASSLLPAAPTPTPRTP